MNTKAKVIGGFLLGTVIGAGAGILMAPTKGSKTRKKLINKSKEMTDNLVDTATKKFNATKEKYNLKLDQLAKNGKVAVDDFSDAAHA